MANIIKSITSVPHGYYYNILVEEVTDPPLSEERVQLFSKVDTLTQEEIDAQIVLWVAKQKKQYDKDQSEINAKADMYLTYEERLLRGF